MHLGRLPRTAPFGLVFMALLAVGCGDDGEPTHGFRADAYASSTATEWFTLQLRLVQETAGFTPPVASRSFAYAGLALYESVVAGMPRYQSLAGQLSGLPPLPRPAPQLNYNWAAVANGALAQINRNLFPTASAENRAAIDALEADLKTDLAAGHSPTDLEPSLAHGRAVADAIFAWSRGDGGHEAYLHNFPADYVPPTGPGLWIPTPPGYQRALQPYWGANRSFAMASAADCDPGPPLPYSTDPGSAFRREAQEVYDTTRTLTPEQQEIANFWSDDPGLTATPPGHSVSILTQIIEQEGATLDTAAEAYAKLGMAVADAFMSCWAAKYEHNLLRPVTYIQAQIDHAWTSPLTTPPFPEFTSGHSVQSAAAAHVLTDLFGPVAFTDHTHDARGLRPRHFDSFLAAADEASISRLYGGIHFRRAIDRGLDQGRCVGAKVLALHFRP